MVKSGLYKILVVDEYPADRILVQKILGKKYTIIEAGNGKEGLDLARSEVPDLILMDIMMPEVNGYLSCYQMKKDPLTTRIPVLMLSSLESELNIRLASEMGAVGYLTKPFEPKELLDKVNQFLLGDQ